VSTPIWDPALEGPIITVPTSILGAPADACNSQADYEEIYPFGGAAHKVSYLIVQASHCVFADPGDLGCDLLCGGDANPDLTQLSQKYMTAWLNYYLHEQPLFYDYLYGANAESDISSGMVQRLLKTSPQDFLVNGLPADIELEWALYEQAMIAGYHIYRRLPGQPFSSTSYASPGFEPGFIDTQVSSGQTYFYKLLSYDPATNEHEESAEVMARSTEDLHKLWVPILVTP